MHPTTSRFTFVDIVLPDDGKRHSSYQADKILIKPDATEKAQIDLVIKRADKVVNVCEMKFYDDIYTMKKKDADDVERRVRIFRNEEKVRTAIHPVLVTTYGLADNPYSHVFQNVVTLKDLFEK